MNENDKGRRPSKKRGPARGKARPDRGPSSGPPTKDSPSGKRPAGQRPSGKHPPGKRPPGKGPRSKPGGPRGRKPLVHHAGPVELRGDKVLTDVFKEAFKAWGEPADLLTHGFHSYPARMHALVARTLLELAEDGAKVLDPFCGSGTTLIEARRRGLAAFGNDLNPLALRLAEVKCHPFPEDGRAALGFLIEDVVEASKDRVRAKAQSRAPLRGESLRLFAPHVLRELGGLYEEVQAVEEEVPRRVLEVVLSSMVVKFSNLKGDTSDVVERKRVGKYIPSEFFGKKAQELLERWAVLDEELPPDAPPAMLHEGDARKVDKAFKGERFDLVVSSPPYGGTYDYHQHHALRFPWLGLDARAFEKKELGARRRQGRGEDAVKRWNDEVLETLRAMKKVLAPEGVVVFLMGDAQLGPVRVPADEQLEALAPKAGLEVVAVASQSRPDWSGRKSRDEHLIALRHAAKAGA